MQKHNPLLILVIFTLQILFIVQFLPIPSKRELQYLPISIFISTASRCMSHLEGFFEIETPFPTFHRDCRGIAIVFLVTELNAE